MSAILSECSQYRRTQKGNEEVVNKSYKLSARQRQFLLLIDKTDTLNRQICERLAHAINIEQLVDLGLLSTAQKVAAAEKNLATAAQNHSQVAVPASMPFEHIAKASEAAPAEPVVIQLTAGEFSHIKATMV